MKKKTMKRALLCALAALMALLTLAGCGEQPEAPPEEEEPAPGIHSPVIETPTLPAEDPPAETPDPSGETPPPASPSSAPLTLLDALYGAGEFNAPTPITYSVMDPTLAQNERIQKIREWYYGTEGNDGQYEQRAYDGSFTAYWDDGKLVKVEVVEAIDPAVPEGTKYYYYYQDGNPYFIYVNDSAHELRLYYWNAEMIRWIESDHVNHDSGNPAYAQYFATAWRLYQVITELG